MCFYCIFKSPQVTLMYNNDNWTMLNNWKADLWNINSHLYIEEVLLLHIQESTSYPDVKQRQLYNVEQLKGQSLKYKKSPLRRGSLLQRRTYRRSTYRRPENAVALPEIFKHFLMNNFKCKLKLFKYFINNQKSAVVLPGVFKVESLVQNQKVS